MALAIFDLDNTLLAGDSDYLWGEFLIANNIVDPVWYKQQNDVFYQDYENGRLQVDKWLEFQMMPLAANPVEKLFAWREKFLHEYIKPLVLVKGQDKIKQHKDQGDIVLIITATNNFITRPIADMLAIETLLSTQAEFKDGKYTGKSCGIITYQDGKIKALDKWLQNKSFTLADSAFYSDSHNDLPLLTMVDHPVAVDPDKTLAAHARLHNWEITSFRD